MSKRGTIQQKYSAEFKISVIMDMLEHHLGYRETVRKYWDVNQGQEHNYHKQVQRWVVKKKWVENKKIGGKIIIIFHPFFQFDFVKNSLMQIVGVSFNTPTIFIKYSI